MAEKLFHFQSYFRSAAAISKRFYSSMSNKRGLILGIYTSTEKEDELKFTSFGEKYNAKLSGQLLEQINIAGPISGGQARLFWSVGSQYPAVAVVGLGDAKKWDQLDDINGTKENVRIASAAGFLCLSHKITEIDVEDFGDTQSAAEGAILGVFKYQLFKAKDKQSPIANINLSSECLDRNLNGGWERGVIVANAQNWARTLMDTPANLMTPTIFADNVINKLKQFDNVKCIAHDRDWAEKKGMHSYLSVSRGSDELPVFLEITYNGAGTDKKTGCLVGKGITFDTGGISLKPSASMDQMRADMGGAANVVGTIAALAEMKAKVNVTGLIPLCENMPNGRATKPGDVVRAMNGKTICVDNTDAEGRLVLADALCYSAEFKPKYILDIATLTGAIKVALGDCVAGVFTNNNNLWNLIHLSGSESGDRVWRMPLFKHYSQQMCDHDGYDLNNLGKGKGGGSCTAAAFLREFVPNTENNVQTPWMHVDMAGVMGDCSDQSYTGSKGMTGRPLRTLVEFVLREAEIIK